MVLFADFGVSWTRPVPNQSFIKHSADGVYPAGWDSHTCYAANGVMAEDGNETHFY